MDLSSRWALAGLVWISVSLSGVAAPALQTNVVARDGDPVLIRGTALPDLSGVPVSDLRVFAYDKVALAFAPIPFQVDERLERVFDEGLVTEFRQFMYDVGGLDDGLLDADDEIAVMFRDAGSLRAPAALPWPAGAGPVSYEIEVHDPRPGTENPTRWLYVFTGSDLPRSGTTYVQWGGTAVSDVTTDQYVLEYSGNWLVTGLRVPAPCGTGADLIDRWKGRARPLPNRQEDEENWSTNSTYLGGLVGPIRAIRYVRGATSGVNTIYHDILYRSFWHREVDLRVHPLYDIAGYFDWRPGPLRTTFLPQKRNGVPLDGSPDSGVGNAFANWSITRTPDGGAALIMDIPPSPLYQARTLFYRDDAAYDDRVPENQTYGDEDNSAYGNVGFAIAGLGNSQFDPITFRWRLYPLCSNQGDASLGDAHVEMDGYPLSVEATARFVEISPIRSLTAQREGADVVLSWAPQASAEGYRVYASTDPALPRESWSLVADVAAPPARDVAPADGLRFYSAVAYAGELEGGW